MSHEQKIILQARELFMRYGIKSITMDDIARELGISKKTLYQYVRNKSDLIDQVTDQYISDEKACMAQITSEASDAIAEFVMISRHIVKILRGMRPTTMFDLKKYYRQCWQKMDEFHLGHVYQVVKKNIERGIEQGLYRSNVNADIIAKLYVGKTMFLADDEMFPMREYDRDQLFIEYVDYHLRGILSDVGLKTLNSYQPMVP